MNMQFKPAEEKLASRREVLPVLGRDRTQTELKQEPEKRNGHMQILYLATVMR